MTTFDSNSFIFNSFVNSVPFVVKAKALFFPIKSI